MPSFGLDRYIKVKESRGSIIANCCWGGYTYHSLGMQFLSPYINKYVEAEDFIRLLNDFDYYMGLPFQHKIGFSTIPCEERDMFYCRIPNGLEDKYADHIGIYLCRVATMEEFGYYDFLKLLNHEKDFGRVTYS